MPANTIEYVNITMIRSYKCKLIDLKIYLDIQGTNALIRVNKL